MADSLSPKTLDRLESERVIWLATVSPAGRPHLTPVWFVWLGGKLYVCTITTTVKARNLRTNPFVVLSLEEGSHPVICEGEAEPVPEPWPEEVGAGFKAKYDWDIAADGEYDLLLEVTPHKWLTW